MRIANIQATARKEYYHLIRDFRSLYLAFILPLVLILLFGYALSLDVEDVGVMVVDHDKTSSSRDFIRQVDASPYFNVIAHLPDDDAAVKELDRGSTTIVLVIPPGWTADIRADRKAQLQVLLDGSDPNFASLSRGYITAFIERYNNRLFVDFLNRQGSVRAKPPVEGRIRVWFNEDLESRKFIVPGIIAVIIMIVGAMLTSLVIAREYENGTMETIKSLPIRAEEFLTGKAIPYFFIAMTDVFVAMLMGQFLFGVVLKSSFWLMVLATTLYLCVALGLGLLISVVTKSQLVANQIAILVTYLPSLLLSDFVFPVANMPKFIQLVTYIVPATYYIDILNGLYLRGLGLTVLWQSYAVLLAMYAVLAALTLIVFRREGM
ncbi:MAG: ABC transporter permease [Deltaproteobacteria bacterium]|nr:ABC transporter permease [Deltaproteobacteria bacterium]